VRISRPLAPKTPGQRFIALLDAETWPKSGSRPARHSARQPAVTPDRRGRYSEDVDMRARLHRLVPYYRAVRHNACVVAPIRLGIPIIDTDWVGRPLSGRRPWSQ
jgi:hypothetical protein